MGEENHRASELLREHGPLLGRVAMALLGESVHVAAALEQVAREVGEDVGRGVPVVSVRAWLLGKVRVASAGRRSTLGVRSRTPGSDEPAPRTERLGSVEARAVRAELGALRPTEREAVILSIVGALDPSEVALACNVDIATARGRIASGLQQLLRAVNQGGTSR